MPESTPEPTDQKFGPVTYLLSPNGGRYPDGNSILVEGERETVLIDPAVGLNTRNRPLPRIDRVLHSHCHEDHIAATHLYPDVPWHFHSLDLPGITSIDAMMAIYGLGGDVETAFRRVIVDDFHYSARPDPTPFEDGDRFDLGGVAIDIAHAPGHTRGHCCMTIAWEEGGQARSLLYLGDIELTSFGPYYGDAWSSLDDFERTLEKVRGMQADYYATFHHIGVLEGREPFLARLDVFESKLASREAALLDYLTTPHTLEEMVAHRFIYRPTDNIPFANPVEHRSITQHLTRLTQTNQIKQHEDGRYQST